MFWVGINSSDFWHHLLTGQFIVQNHSLPHLDTFTFSAAGLPWIAHSWASGLLYYLIYILGGPLGISLLFFLLGLLTTLGIYIYSHKNIWLSLLLAALISLRWPTRPEILAGLFMVTLLNLLKFNKSKYLPIFFFLWSIFYGSSVFLGLTIYLIYLVTSKQLDKPNLIRFFLCVLASFLNGYGLDSILYITRIPSIAPSVGEWLPSWVALNPDLYTTPLFYQFPFFFFLSLLSLTFIIFFRQRPKLHNLFPLILALFALAPIFSIRFLNLYPILLLPLLNILKLPKSLLFASAITIAIYSFSAPQTGIFPTQAVEFLSKHQLNGNILSDQNEGAYIRYHLPKSQIFYDTRDELYQQTQVVADLSKLNVLQLTHKYQADLVLVSLSEYYHPLVYDPKWHLLFVGEGYAIFSSKDDNLPRLDALDPFQIPPAKKGMLNQALTQIDEHSPENVVRKIQLLLADNQYEQALSLVPKISLKSRLEDYDLLNSLYLAAHDCPKAKLYFDLATKLTKHRFLFNPWYTIPTSAKLCNS